MCHLRGEGLTRPQTLLGEQPVAFLLLAKGFCPPGWARPSSPFRGSERTALLRVDFGHFSGHWAPASAQPLLPRRMRTQSLSLQQCQGLGDRSPRQPGLSAPATAPVTRGCSHVSVLWFALGNAPEGSSRGTGGMQGSFRGLQTLHATASPGWQLLPTPGSPESPAGSPALGVMILPATSSCLSPFQAHWVLPSAFPSSPGPCWRISPHIAQINELRRDACPGTRPSVCPLPG